MSRLMEATSPRSDRGNDPDWQPHLIALACNWCTYAGADMAGTLRLAYPPNVHILRLPCTGQMNPLYVLKAFEQGADGVIVSGCHPGDCHYSKGNMLARRRAAALRRLMHLLGLDPRRLHFAWVSASEGAKWAKLVSDVVEEVRQAGPIGDWAAPEGFRAGEELTLPAPPAPPRQRPAPASTSKVTEHLRTLARQLLESGAASQVIGFQKSNGSAAPVLISQAEHAATLVWDDTCHSNLTTYLTRNATGRLREGAPAKPGMVSLSVGGKALAEPKAQGAVAVVVKPCDAKSIVAFRQESQFDGRRVVVIAAPCEGVWHCQEGACNGDGKHSASMALKCYACPGGIAPGADWVITPEGPVQGGEKKAAAAAPPPLPTAPDPRIAQVEALWAAAPQQRWSFWQEQFQLCLRCDACRAVCPMCYCESCVTEKHRPQWISPAADAVGNTAWNFIRAFHLVGRCIGCDECARACPADIRIDLITFALAREIETRFGYRAGEDPESAPPLATFKPDDAQEFIR
jgi:coenzyme F420-reducing hydrogenase delta subunit/ferredoxin